MARLRDGRARSTCTVIGERSIGALTSTACTRLPESHAIRSQKTPWLSRIGHWSQCSLKPTRTIATRHHQAVNLTVRNDR